MPAYTMTEARLNTAFRSISEREGFCNAFAPISDAIDSMIEDGVLEQGDEFYESTEGVNLDFVKRIIDACSGAVDIDPGSADLDTRRIKIENLIKDLEAMK